MPTSDYNPAYYDGRIAAIDGLPESECPYGFICSESESPVKVRENSQIAKRHWWLAGYHDQKNS